MSDEPRRGLTCFKCGSEMSEANDRVFYRVEVNIGTPMFCSKKCCESHDPQNVTYNSILGMISQLRVTQD